MSDFAETGRLWLRRAIPQGEVRALREAGSENGRIAPPHPVFDPAQTWCAAVRSLWPAMRPVRAVGFDKRKGANWAVPWHQDRIIAVKDRRDVPGFSNWSQKSGVWHCAPPLDILRPMLFGRLQLDAGDAGSGAMEIALGSHRAGHVTAADAGDVAGRCEIEVAEAEPGDVLVLSMLMLHRSRPSRVDAPRRTFRLYLSDRTLPFGLDWTM